MNFDSANVLNSGIPVPELYGALSSEGIRGTGFNTGVLLYFCTSRFIHYECNLCSQGRASCVYAAGGSIVYVTDKEILAEWPEEKMQLRCAVTQAVQCAFKIQDTCKIQRTTEDPRRPVKIAISVGRFSIVRPGDQDGGVCVVIGPAVDKIRSAVALADHCDVVLCPETWRLCNLQNLTIEHIGSEGAVKVQHFRGQPRISQYDLRLGNLDIPRKRPPKRGYLVTNMERENVVCKFMMQIALEKIHQDEEWQDLPEIWPATIMVMNLQFMQTHTDPSARHYNVSDIIAEQMYQCRGEICNSFFFEEGCIFVCMIVLPGDKRKDKTDQALRAANRIHETCLREIENLWIISVGVTTGRVPYEFKHDSLRREYKAYGEMVYKAAKLTTDNPGIVSSDVATKLYSMLPLSHLIPERKISPYEEVHYRKEIYELLADEAAATSEGMDGRRLALAHMQTMVLHEQRVVNNASAIGHTFTFEMLKSILPRMSEQDLITSLRSLVGVGIIKCASKTCDCKKNSKHNSRTDHTQISMDPVWQCRLMSFCKNDEMEMVHQLVQNNKYLFRAIHTKCANYLEKKAYRCTKCEDKTFISEHKAATDDNNQHLQEIYNTIRPYEAFQSQGVPCQNKMTPTEENGNETENFLAKVKSVLTEARDRAAGSCECDQLVETVLIPRLRHWRCAGNVPKTFYYLLESAAASAYLHKDAKALEYLTEASSILENLKERKLAFPSADPESVQICELEQAFMHRLTGEILFKAGKLLEAEESFRKVLKLLKFKLPRNSAAQSSKLICEKIKKLYYRSRRFKIPKKTKLGRLQECIICLSFLWQIGCMRGHLKSASLAITMQINLATQSADPFKILFSAIDYLKYSHLKGEESECRRLEAFLCSTCASLSDHPEGRRLISHLTQTLAVVKMCTGELEQSAECTLRAQQLSEVLKDPGLDVRTTAALHLPLLLTDRYRESVQQMQTLENHSTEMSSSVAKGWFYAACMNSLLYAGFVVRPFEECLAFVEKSPSVSDANVEADKSLMLHLYSAVALWYARLANWEKFAVFFDKAYAAYAQVPTCIESISGAVMLQECSVLFLRKQQTEWNIHIRNTLNRTKKLFSDFTRRFGENHILVQRALHLNAYMHELTLDKLLAQDLLKEALLLCEKQGNLLDRMWIKQSQGDWSGADSDTRAEWSTAVLSMPSWDEAAVLQPEQLLKYRFPLERKRPSPCVPLC